MTYRPGPLSDPNILADRVGLGNSSSLVKQVAPAYNPAPPDYSKNRRMDAGPDRPLPRQDQLVQPGVRTTPHGRSSTLPNGSQGRIHVDVDSGVGQLIQALTGVDNTDYRQPLPKKPISQRNKFR